MEKNTYKRPAMRVIALHQSSCLMSGSDPTTNEVNATRDNYMGGAAWQWS